MSALHDNWVPPGENCLATAPGGWPLDELLVGVATLRASRELFRLSWVMDGPLRPWDVALWSGVSPQGAANSLARMERIGLVLPAPRARPDAARRFAPNREHPLWGPLSNLFYEERLIVGRARRPTMRDPTFSGHGPSNV